MSDNVPTLDVIIVIGSTGLGKSTLIKSYCKTEAIVTSSSSRSCTKEPKLFTTANDNAADDNKNDDPTEQIWVDTMGAEDDAKELKDEDILSSVMQMLIDYVPNNVKLRLKMLWFVKLEMRQTGALQTQAKYIKQFDDGSDKNAWNSTIIVLNKGQLDPSRSRDLQGALAASYKYGASWQGLTDSDENKLGNVKCIGYTRIDCLDDDDLDLELYNDPNMSNHSKKRRGLLNEEEMITEVNKLLNAIEYLPISIHKQKCEKCGVIGDKRWVNLLCHGTSNKIHPEGDTLIHTANIIYIHQLVGTEPYHDGYIIKYHSGSLRSEKVGGKYHSGSYRSGSSRTESYGVFCPYCTRDIECNFMRTTKGSFTCNRCNCKVGVGGVTYYCTKCPPNNFGYTQTGKSGTWKSCHYCKVCCDTKTRTVNSAGSWSCCRSSSSSASGCKQDSVDRYSCCGGSRTSNGCCRKWSCCGRNGDSANNGCKQRHICCKKLSGSQGCKQVYGCCRKDTTDIGCSYACCRKKIASPPCFTECSNCHREYGTWPGCLQENVAHQMIDLE